MKFYSVGDKTKALCEDCGAVVEAVYGYHDVAFDDGVGIAKGILAAACRECGTVVAIPAQSLPALRRARPVVDVPLEVELPAPDLEILDAVSSRVVSRPTTRHRKMVLAYYALLLASRGDAGAVISAAAQVLALDEQRKGKGGVPKKRLSFRISDEFDATLHELMEESGLKKSATVRAIIQFVREDVTGPNAIGANEPSTITELRRVAQTMSA
jgi:hypothetical protein